MAVQKLTKRYLHFNVKLEYASIGRGSDVVVTVTLVEYAVMMWW